MSKHGRGVCPVCKRDAALTAGGNVWRHDPPPHKRVSKLASCDGSWQRAAGEQPRAAVQLAIGIDGDETGELGALFDVSSAVS